MKNQTRFKYLGLVCALAIVLVGALLIGLGGQKVAAHAERATYTVTTTDSGGPGSLRQAILSANANPGADQIVFDLPGCASATPCVISLINPLPLITDSLTITGTGMTSLIIDANDSFRGLNIENAPVTLADLTVQNGNTPGRGAGIRSSSALTLTRVRLLNNDAEDTGGGVYAGGPLTIRDSYFAQNTSLYEGGGLYAEVSLGLESTEFFSNTAASNGGGAYGNGEVWITGGRFEQNRAENFTDGGGLYAASHITLTGTVFFSNTVGDSGDGGGLYASENVWATGAWFENNESGKGGGLFSDGNLILEDTTFLANMAYFDNGGGAYGGGDTWVSGGRFEQNTSGGDGGGLFGGASLNSSVTVTGTVFLSNTVTSSGSGGGLFTYGNASVSLAHFERNHSNLDGGGVFVSGELTLADTIFLWNTTDFGYGGGAYGAETVWVSGGRFERNHSASEGGGLLGNDAVILTGTVFLSNTAVSTGGGLYAYGNVQAVQTWFEGNQGEDGGGVYVYGDFDLIDGTFLHNNASEKGGGAYVLGEIHINASRFEHNQSALDGGGLKGSSNVHLTDTWFTSNTAQNGDGGGLYLLLPILAAESTEGFPALWLTRTHWISNTAMGLGGGLASHLPMSVDSSTFIGNQANAGGGIYHGAGIGLVVNTLFARNAANTEAAALALDSPGQVTLIHATLVGEPETSTAGIGMTSGTLLMGNSIITQFATGILNLNGVFNQDYNLFYQNGTDINGSFSGGAHTFDGDPMFVAPETDDYHLSAGSAALDVGLDAGIAADFEGQPRPLGNGFDLGFDEADLISGLTLTYSPSPTITLQTPAVFTATVTGGSGITYTWDFGDGSPDETGNPISHTYLTPGVYTVTVTAANSSGSVSTSVEVEVVQGEIPPLEYQVYLPTIVR